MNRGPTLTTDVLAFLVHGPQTIHKVWHLSGVQVLNTTYVGMASSCEGGVHSVPDSLKQPRRWMQPPQQQVRSREEQTIRRPENPVKQ
jgi:hypothetical protein